MAKKPVPQKGKPKAGDLAAMRNPAGLSAGKAAKATFQPTKSDERERPIGRKGLVGGKGY